MSNPKVAWNIRLGTVGESAIKTRLAYFSTVTKYETDLGIDYYCELIENDSPSTPFYVQAKGTEHFDSSWGQSIAKSTIMYWLRQEFPVFLIVYNENDGNCYWMSVEDHRYSLIQRMFGTNSNTIYVKMDRSNVLEKGRGKNEAFVTKVKADLASIRLFRGHPQFIGEEYVKKIPSPPRSNVELLRIKENVRVNMYSLVQHCIKTNDLEAAWLYCSFLADFDKSHYNHFVWLGKISKVLGKTEVAKRSFEEALRICEADKNWPRDPMSEIIAAIKQETLTLQVDTEQKSKGAKMKITDFKDVMAEEVKEPGSKDVTVRWLISEKDGAPNFAMRIFEVEPGGFTPFHKHSWEHEVFILQGRGILVTEEKNYPLKKDDAVFAPPDEKHQFKNDSQEKFTFICVVPVEKRP